MNIEKALVVDDSKVAHLTLRKLLSERGITVDWVGSGEESIDYLKKQQPDVIFMDVMMPGMDGFETASAVNNDSNIKAPPIIMCSANTTEEDKQTASNNGATGFLTKPYTAEELDDVLTLVRNMTTVVDAPLASNEDDAGTTEIEISALEDDDFDLSIAPLDLEDAGAEAEAEVDAAPAIEPDSQPAAAAGVQISDAELMHRVEQAAWSTADEVARRVATETTQSIAEQTAREVSGNFTRKATQVAARAAQSIAERVAQETAKSAAAEALSNIGTQAADADSAAAGIDIESLRREISDNLQEQLTAKVQTALAAAMQSDEFKEQITQLMPQNQGEEAADVAAVAKEAATKAAWEAIAAKEEDDQHEGSAASKVANTALLFSLLALVLSGGLFVFTFFL